MTEVKFQKIDDTTGILYKQTVPSGVDPTIWEAGTDEQRQAYAKIQQRWDVVDPPVPALMCNVWMVQVKSDSTGCSMWLGIEPDGHTHS